MIKSMLIRGINSFMYSVAITVVLYTLIMVCGANGGAVPLVPDYAVRFDSPVIGVLVQCVLIGLTSAAFGAGSVIMEVEQLGMITQSIIYFIVTAMVWIPVACFCWGFHKYLGSMVSVMVSYVISYFISWLIQYRICRRNVEEINRKLMERNG